MQTDDRGELRLEHVAAGAYTVSADDTSRRGEAAVEVSDAGEATVVVRLERP